MQSMALALVFLLACCAQALNTNRIFVEKMVVEEETEVINDGQHSYRWADHAFFRYLKQHHAPMLPKGQDKVQGGLKTFKWQDCGSSTELLKIEGLAVTPDPVVLPGSVSVKFSVSLNLTVDAPLKMQLEVKKREGPLWITIPCIGQIGSCTYDDLCDTLSGATCPPEFVKNNIPCKCPFPKGAYDFPTATYEVNTDVVPSGDYHAKVNLYFGDKPVYCLDAYASIDSK